MKHILPLLVRSIVIFLFVIFFMMPGRVLAQFTYSTNAGGSSITITGYTGSGGIVNIPASINGLAVTGIGFEAFGRNTNITSLTIPNGVTTLGDYAFGLCQVLGSVSIPGTVTNFGDSVFLLCTALTNATISNGVTTIGPGMFAQCTSLISLTFPTNITNIEAGAFSDTALTRFVIPPSVTVIGDQTFEGTPLMTNITIPPSVTGIGQFSFDGCGITSITIPNSVTYIEYGAFVNCANLTNVTIPSSVTSMGDLAFSGCDSLTYAIISKGVPSLGFGAFEDSPNLLGVFCESNAPTTTGEQGDSTNGPVFNGDTNVTVYYLAGTTGWSNTYQGVPAVEWNPQIQVHNANFGMSSNQFGFSITGNTNIPFLLEGCTSLANPVWTPLTNVNLTNGSFYFCEPMQSNCTGRYYRVCFP